MHAVSHVLLSNGLDSLCFIGSHPLLLSLVIVAVDKFLEIAQAEVGVVEAEGNKVKYNKNNGQPWCGYFVNWCATKAKIKIPNCVYTPAGKAGFQGLGTWFNSATEKPQPGDIVFFDFPGGEKVDHVGIILKDNGDGTVTTIEGNTSHIFTNIHSIYSINP